MAATPSPLARIFSKLVLLAGSAMRRNVKRWHDGDQRERWVGSGLLVAEKQFRRAQGYKQLPHLIRQLEAIVPSKGRRNNN